MEIFTMSSRKFAPKHLELRHNTYFAVLFIPKEVRPIIGKLKYYETTGTHDLKIAQAIATIKVIKWKTEIANARKNTEDPILKSAIELNRLLKTSPKHLVQDVIEEETNRLETESSPLVSTIFNEIATGKTKPLADYIQGWIANESKRGLAEKTIFQMKSDVELMISHLPTTNFLVAEHTSNWIKKIAEKGNLSAASVTRIIGSCRNFFKYLKFIDLISEKTTEQFFVPKKYVLSKKRNSKSQNKTESWLPFEKEDVEKIYFESIRKEDWELAQLITLASYTGARIEEICSLEQRHVDLKNKCVYINYITLTKLISKN